MSTDPNLATAQLLDLLLTLKSTTPAAAKGILNSQPAIAYALITLMVSMGAIKTDVFQKTLAASAAQGGAPKPQPPTAVAPPAMHMPPPMPPHITPSHSHSSSSTPVPALPPHMQQNPYGYRTATPPHSTPTPPIGGPPAGYGAYPPNNGYGSQYPPGPPPPGPYGAYPQAPGYPPGPPQHHTPTPVPAPAPDLAATLAAIPEESRALVVRVVSMSPEQIHALPPSDRATYIQIRATLGIATPGP